MKNLNHNIEFSYLYRDASNYKIFGSLIFVNPQNLLILEIEKRIKSSLIDGEFFDPEKCNVPALKFVEFDKNTDHFWNEYEKIEITTKANNDYRNMEEFLIEIENKK